MSLISNTHLSNPYPSIEQFEEAANKPPEAPTLIHITGQGFKAVQAPRMGLLSMFGLGSYFDEVDKSHKTVKAFKEALKKKYGDMIADYVFAPKVEGETLRSGLTHKTIKTVLNQAKALDLLKQEIVDTITDESSESQAQDTVWRDIPNAKNAFWRDVPATNNKRIFKPATIQLIKKAYSSFMKTSEMKTSLMKTSKMMNVVVDAHISDDFKTYTAEASLDEIEEATSAVTEDLNKSKFLQTPVFVSDSFPMQAMRIANQEISTRAAKAK